ncbi:MAG: hypothetical protein R6X14_04180, partial [bacterium]
MPRRSAKARSASRSSRRSDGPARRTTRLVLTISSLVILLFVLVSIIAHRTGPDTTVAASVGMVGRQLGKWSSFALGWMSIALAITAGAGLVASLLRRPPWQKFSGLLLLGWGVLFSACIVSWQTGAVLPVSNFGGWFGTMTAGGLSILLGLGSYLIPALMFIWGSRLWA